MKLSDFYYDLPASGIAQAPAEPRDHSRLMVIGEGVNGLTHHRFFELDGLLRPGDVLVANATRVFPARLRGKKKTGGKIEVLLLASESGGWRALIRGTTKPSELIFKEGMSAIMERRFEDGEWLLRFSEPEIRPFLERHGEMPLPPYIKRAQAETADQDRYQTVYAKDEGAVAAPTAGFHFTSDLIERLRQKGVHWLEVVLHVGWGTFRPIREETVTQHQMFPERYEVSSATADALNVAQREKRRIIAIGTTVVRTLETVADVNGAFRSGSGQSDLFITPGYRFKSIDALITNFHLPDSTPLLLANAFYAHRYPDSPDFPFVLKTAYQEAIRQKYRFYSYGDAMLIQ